MQPCNINEWHFSITSRQCFRSRQMSSLRYSMQILPLQLQKALRTTYSKMKNSTKYEKFFKCVKNNAHIKIHRMANIFCSDQTLVHPMVLNICQTYASIQFFYFLTSKVGSPEQEVCPIRRPVLYSGNMFVNWTNNG